MPRHAAKIVAGDGIRHGETSTLIEHHPRKVTIGVRPAILRFSNSLRVKLFPELRNHLARLSICMHFHARGVEPRQELHLPALEKTAAKAIGSWRAHGERKNRRIAGLTPFPLFLF